jgi:hypothetical protein
LKNWNEDVQQRLTDYWAGVADRWQQIQPDFDKIRPYLNQIIDSSKAKLMGLCY